MSKKTKIISILICAVVLIVAIIAAVFIVPKDNLRPDNDAMTPPASSTQDLDIEKLQATDQYKDIAFGDNQYAAYLGTGKLNDITPTELTLATWTVDQYLQNAILNPYFVSGYWQKDSYNIGTIDKYIAPYISSEVYDSLVQDLSSVDADAPLPETISNKIFTPSTSAIIPPQCYDTWQEDYCFSDPYKINDFSFTGNGDNTINVNVDLTLSTLSQKLNSAEGNLSSQSRTYSFSFVLSLENEPDTDTTKIPIMIIENIDSTLVVDEMQDYLINEG